MPADEAGATTLLTNLANHLQPLIRYDLGDCLTLHSKGCACGSHLPVIEVQGRSDDTLRLGRPGAQAVRVLALALSTVLEDDAGLFDFQLVQQGPCELLLSTALRGQAGSSALRRAAGDARGLPGTARRGRRAHPLPQRPAGPARAQRQGPAGDRAAAVRSARAWPGRR
ncbi:MAG TPA: hypothetical protein VES36_11460 [Candidatus Limnocylindrales bacterium]|nr:hypothetical protein [Candidatus Limnocylindrales bacterium]